MQNLISTSLNQSVEKVQQCVKEIKLWMNNNMLKLNDDKTEVLFIASPYFQKSLERDACLIIDQTSVSRSQSARNIGVIFDDEMLLKQHISTVCQTAFFHLRSIGQIRRYLTEDSCMYHTCPQPCIGSNRLLQFSSCELASMLSSKSFSELNTAARIVSLRPKRDDIIPVLISLHWLPIEHRIHYKVILFVFHCLHNLAPSYLSELLKLYAPERENLRSSDKLCPYIPLSHYSKNVLRTYYEHKMSTFVV